MLPLYVLLNFLARLAGISTALWWVSNKTIRTQLPDVVANHLWEFTTLFAWAVLYVDGHFIYPRYRSPLRHLPKVSLPTGRDITLVTEMPRGATPLQWAAENPGADLLNIQGLRFTPETVIPLSPEALRDLMSTNTYDFVKPSGLRTFLAGVIGWGLITTEGNVHKRLRKALIPAFNVKHIRALYPTMWEQTGILVEQMQKTCAIEGNVEITEWASRLALDIIGRSALSRNFQSLSTSEHPVAKSFTAILEPEPHMVIFLGLNLVFPVALTRLLPLKANRVVRRESAYLRRFCTELLADQKRILALKATHEKPANDPDDHTILRNIIQSGDFDDEELIDQMLTFIAAGHETTGSSIAWAMHLLTLPENRHYQAVIRDEIRRAFPPQSSPPSPQPSQSDSTQQDEQQQQQQQQPPNTFNFDPRLTPSWSEFESLPYLNGLCEEVLRLFPAVPTTLRESIRPTTLASHPIPRDTLILVCPWAINRNPTYWGPDASSFRPERWIDQVPNPTSNPPSTSTSTSNPDPNSATQTQPQIQIQPQKYTLRANRHGGSTSNYCEITFLHGQRACIGRDFAKAELRCVLAGILGRFEVARLKGDTGHDVEITGAVTTKPRGGLKLDLTVVPGW